MLDVPHVTAGEIIFERNTDVLRLPFWLFLDTRGRACLFLFCSTSRSLSLGQILVSSYQFNCTKLQFKGTSISCTLRDGTHQKAFCEVIFIYLEQKYSAARCQKMPVFSTAAFIHILHRSSAWQHFSSPSKGCLFESETLPRCLPFVAR